MTIWSSAAIHVIERVEWELRLYALLVQYMYFDHAVEMRAGQFVILVWVYCVFIFVAPFIVYYL